VTVAYVTTVISKFPFFWNGMLCQWINRFLNVKAMWVATIHYLVTSGSKYSWLKHHITQLGIVNYTI